MTKMNEDDENHCSERETLGEMGWTALCRAVQAGDREKCRELLKGAIFWSPLEMAVERGNLAIVKFLVNEAEAVIQTRAKADIYPPQDGEEEEEDEEEEKKKTFDMVALAACYGHLDIVRFLIDAGADLSSHELIN